MGLLKEGGLATFCTCCSFVGDDASLMSIFPILSERADRAGDIVRGGGELSRELLVDLFCDFVDVTDVGLETLPSSGATPSARACAAVLTIISGRQGEVLLQLTLQNRPMCSQKDGTLSQS